ncbi:MAG: hypothetical protein AB7E52_06865 [Bdellovibrionales bacterium]
MKFLYFLGKSGLLHALVVLLGALKPVMANKAKKLGEMGSRIAPEKGASGMTTAGDWFFNGEGVGSWMGQAGARINFSERKSFAGRR